MTNRYQELENQVKELQKEIDRLKKEEQEYKLLKNFSRERVISYLNKPNYTDLCCAFGWESTLQGLDYWYSISQLEPHKVPEQAIIQLQKWVIQSYQEQYGN